VWRWGIDTVILMRVLETQGSPAINGVREACGLGEMIAWRSASPLSFNNAAIGVARS
jgi:hypothetical protein